MKKRGGEIRKKEYNLLDGLLGDTVFVANLLNRQFDNPFDFFLDLHTHRRKQTYEHVKRIIEVKGTFLENKMSENPIFTNLKKRIRAHRASSY